MKTTVNRSAKQSGRLARFYGHGGGRARLRRWRRHRAAWAGRG